MILEYNNGKYIDVDSITVLGYTEINNTDCYYVVTNKDISIIKEEYETIEKAFRWLHQHSIYDKDLKKGER